jgi:bacteriorhodopsin
MELLAAIVVLLVIAAATLPTWPYSQRWSFYPTGACGGLVLFLVAMILTGHF